MHPLTRQLLDAGCTEREAASWPLLIHNAHAELANVERIVAQLLEVGASMPRMSNEELIRRARGATATVERHETQYDAQDAVSPSNPIEGHGSPATSALRSCTRCHSALTSTPYSPGITKLECTSCDPDDLAAEPETPARRFGPG